jgi:integral membrane protein (TIGR01906 family)
MRIRARWAVNLGMALAVFAVLVTCIDFFCFRRSFYAYEYAKSDTAAQCGMSDADLEKTTGVLLDYLQDRRSDLVTTAVINGSEREVFDSREKAHMVDVKNLYRNALTVRNIAAAAAAVLLICGLRKNRGSAWKAAYQGWKIGACSGLAFVGAIIVWALLDFDQFWLNFHYLFFDNDLFLLDPNTEILINMVPATFFEDLVIRIILLFSGVILAVWMLLRAASVREQSK